MSTYLFFCKNVGLQKEGVIELTSPSSIKLLNGEETGIVIISGEKNGSDGIRTRDLRRDRPAF